MKRATAAAGQLSLLDLCLDEQDRGSWRSPAATSSGATSVTSSSASSG
jgi:hypothetical protein